MVGPWISFLPAVLEVDALTNFLAVDEFLGEATPQGQRAIKIEDTETVSLLSHGGISAGSSVSLELINTRANFQTSGPAKVILIITAGVTTITDMEIREDASADAGTGPIKEDFPSTSIGNTTRITTKVLSFAASKFITIKLIAGSITSVECFVIQ